jgi:dolichyl-phosphate-mannose--protein O-mannosyl transferase
MNEIDRGTPLTLWISVSSGLVAAGSLAWVALSRSKREAQPLSTKQWLAIALWGPLSACFVGWSINWAATILPGETSVVQATAESFRPAEEVYAHAT